MSLNDQLHALADDAPDGAQSSGAGELWERGRRYGRARRAGTAAVVAGLVLALVGLGLVGHQRSETHLAPVSPSGVAGIPNRLYTPSPWLRGTDDAGPLGQLAAIIPVRRESLFGSSEGYVGVSATTGEYLFLDLPDLTLDGTYGLPQMSPDGRQVAYWYSVHGSTSTPDGYAVFDTSTGTVRRQPVTSAHGIGVVGLLWSDERTLMAKWFVRGDDAHDAGTYAAAVWPIGEDPVTLPQRLVSEFGSASDDYLIRGHRVFEISDPSTPRPLGRWVWGPRSQADRPAIDPTGRRIAYISPAHRPASLVISPVGARPQRSALTGVPGSYIDFAADILGWSDADHLVLVITRSGAHRNVISEVDTRTGGPTRSVVMPNSVPSYRDQVAVDLMSAPAAVSIRPPTPANRRVIAAIAAGAAAAALLVAGVALLLVRRRRVRP